MIEVRNLVKKYGNHTAVNGLTFTVEDGKVYGFLGPNGAGKSTTMNMMIGYLSATSGEIIINGHNIFEEPEEAKKCVGYLPEIPPLYMDMTVKEYLTFVADLKKVPRKERKKAVEEAMAMTNITDMANRMIMHLSKGYKQRVGLSQAILGYPEIIILDEPMVGLDPKQIIEMREVIKKLSEKHTIILSSHIMQEIKAVCDHILIINKGELAAQGTPEELAETLQGRQEVMLTVKGSQSQTDEVLKFVKNIFKREFKPSEEEGTTNVLIYAEKNEDIRESIFKAFAKSALSILGMSAYSKNLEDIFLEITSKEDKKLLSRKPKNDEKTTESEEVTEEVIAEEAAEDSEAVEQENQKESEE